MKKRFVKIIMLGFILFTSTQHIEAKTIRATVENMRAPGMELLIEVTKNPSCGDKTIALSSPEQNVIKKMITNKDMTQKTESALLDKVRAQKSNLKLLCSENLDNSDAIENKLVQFIYRKIYFLNLTIILTTTV